MIVAKSVSRGATVASYEQDDYLWYFVYCDGLGRLYLYLYLYLFVCCVFVLLPIFRWIKIYISLGIKKFIYSNSYVIGNRLSNFLTSRVPFGVELLKDRNLNFMTAFFTPGRESYAKSGCWPLRVNISQGSVASLLANMSLAIVTLNGLLQELFNVAITVHCCWKQPMKYM